jgi:hypothetical protein
MKILEINHKYYIGDVRILPDPLSRNIYTSLFLHRITSFHDGNDGECIIKVTPLPEKEIRIKGRRKHKTVAKYFLKENKSKIYEAEEFFDFKKQWFNKAFRGLYKGCIKV